MHSESGSNSDLHARALANHAPEGWQVVICYPPYEECLRGDLLKSGVDGVVAWTPRESVRLAVNSLVAEYGVPYFVHLEDNEKAITATHLCVPHGRIFSLRARLRYRHLKGRALSHPIHMERFMRGAAGVTVLMDRLLEMVPCGVRRELFWPGYDEELFGDMEVWRGRDVTDGATTLVYTGNVHPNNSDEMATLYGAVVELNRRCRSVRLLRSGGCYDDGFAGRVVAAAPYVTDFGVVAREELPGLLAKGDILVQPGVADEFNEFRFPSKLPEFFASGRPVILPVSNLGRFLSDGAEALLLYEGSVQEIADKVELLMDTPELAERIGRGGQRFAYENLRWGVAAERFFSFIEKGLEMASGA